MKRYARGFSLVEVMIGATIGLVIAAGALALFTTQLRADAERLHLMKVNGAVRDTLSYISREFRRIGYWSLAASAAAPTGNLTLAAATGADVSATVTGGSPFASFGEGAVGLRLVGLNGEATISSYVDGATVGLDIASPFNQTQLASGSWRMLNPFEDAANPTIQPLTDANHMCVLYQYDRDENTTVDDADRAGLRLNPRNDTIERWTGGDYGCDEGTWEALTDPLQVRFTGFVAGLSERVLDLDGAGAGVSQNIVRDILVNLAAESPTDPTISLAMVQTIRLRNDRYVP